MFGVAPISVDKYSDDFNPSIHEHIGISINSKQDSTILYATSLSNLIHPNLTASNTITCPLTGDLKISDLLTTAICFILMTVE